MVPLTTTESSHCCIVTELQDLGFHMYGFADKEDILNISNFSGGV
jgi:hypothetical protein